MTDPVSWLVIEKGWRVVDRDGGELGRVSELVGDTGKDIFNGLSVTKGLLSSNVYVPAEVVGTITEGEVRLGLDARGFERLDAYAEPPASEEFRP